MAAEPKLGGIDSQLSYADRRRVLEMLELSGPAWCTVVRFELDDADDLLDAWRDYASKASC